MIKVIEVEAIDPEAKYPIDLVLPRMNDEGNFPISKEEAIQLLTDLRKAVANLE